MASTSTVSALAVSSTHASQSSIRGGMNERGGGGLGDALSLVPNVAQDRVDGALELRRRACALRNIPRRRRVKRLADE